MSSSTRTVAEAAASPHAERRTDLGPRQWDDLRPVPLEALVGAEQELIQHRRQRAGLLRKMPYVGLALSGGGVRSATFNLGVLQSLAASGALRSVDYLSTVSGGGYIGAFLGRFYTRFINRPVGAVSVVEARLTDPTSPEIAWLRRGGGYMAVSAGLDSPATTAVLLRSFLTVHVLLGTMLVAILNVANLLRYGGIESVFRVLRRLLIRFSPLSLPADVLPTVNPWAYVLAIAVLGGFLPLAIAYWMPSASRPESYNRTRLAAFLIVSTTALAMSLAADAWLAGLGVVVMTIAVFFWVETGWARVALEAPGATVFAAGRAVVRNQFNKWLAIATVVVTSVASLCVLDIVVLETYPEGRPLQWAVLAILVTLGLLFGPVRWLESQRFMRGGARHRDRGWRAFVHSFLLPTVACALVLMQWDLISHEMFRRGADVGSGMVWTAVAVGVSLMLGGKSGVAMVNRSSQQLLYAARGSRTYLGASNPYRHSTEQGADVTSPQAEDDVPFTRYQPDLAGGPLHLINVLARKTVDRQSGRRTHDLPGENMAVGPCGVSVGAASHGLWTDHRSGKTVEPMIDVGELPAPFVTRRGSLERVAACIRTPAMQLSDWMAISGGALPRSEQRATSLGQALLSGLTNVRSGVWWDSGIEDGNRLGELAPSIPQRLGRWLRRRIRAQSCLFNEFTGRFTGPIRRYWYLSDGGLGDSLGIYELVRRKVPIIICADATRDAAGGLSALARAIRRVRVDLRADIHFLSAAELDQLGARLAETSSGLPTGVRDAIGPLDDLRFSRKSSSRAHAALARVTYPGDAAPSLLIYIKASVTGDESADVLEYQRQHPRFPHQSVRDQSLSEAQWESYRQLGQHCARPLFPRAAADSPAWFELVLQDVQAREVIAAAVK